MSLIFQDTFKTLCRGRGLGQRGFVSCICTVFGALSCAELCDLSRFCLYSEGIKSESSHAWREMLGLLKARGRGQAAMGSVDCQGLVLKCNLYSAGT